MELIQTDQIRYKKVHTCHTVLLVIHAMSFIHMQKYCVEQHNGALIQSN